jgi:hypothetical protein
MKKTKVTIFIKKDAKSTKILTEFIAKNIDELSKFLVIDLKQVTAKNAGEVKRLGVDRTPTLVYNGKRYVSLEKIIRILTPPKNARETYGLDTGNPDELIHKYHNGVIHTRDDDEEDDPRINRDDEIRRKMASFQKRRPQMMGMESSDRYLRGGRKITARKRGKNEFNNDDEFRREARVDEQEDTPHSRYFSEEDGDLILENYYNHEADLQGRKKNTKPIRWST